MSSLSGVHLTLEQAEVKEVLDEIARRYLRPDAEPGRVDAARAVLAAQGFWLLDDEDVDDRTRTLVVQRISRVWPALGIACVHAQAAGIALRGADGAAEQLLAIGEQGAPIGVLDVASPVVTVDESPGALHVRAERLDVTHPAPDLLVLLDDRRAALVPAIAITSTEVRITGLDGSRTIAVDVQVERPWIVDADVTGARRCLRTGHAAVAAGIADAAAEKAEAYAAQRVQFGAPLAAIPSVRASLDRQMAGASVALACAFVDRQSPGGAKAAADAALSVASDALQVHGGYGYLAEYGAEGLVRDAVSLRAVATTLPGNR